MSYQFSVHSSFVEENDVSLFKKASANRDELFYNGYFLTDDGSIEVVGSQGARSLLSYSIAFLALIAHNVREVFVRKYRENEPEEMEGEIKWKNLEELK